MFEDLDINELAAEGAQDNEKRVREAAKPVANGFKALLRQADRNPDDIDEIVAAFEAMATAMKDGRVALRDRTPIAQLGSGSTPQFSPEDLEIIDQIRQSSQDGTLAGAQTRIVTVFTDNETLKQQVQTLRGDLETSEREKRALQQAPTNSDELDRLMDEVEDLKQQLETAKNAPKVDPALKQQLDAANTAKTKLQTDLTKAQTDLNSANTDKTRIAEERDALQLQIDNDPLRELVDVLKDRTSVQKVKDGLVGKKEVLRIDDVDYKDVPDEHKRLLGVVRRPAQRAQQTPPAPNPPTGSGQQTAQTPRPRPRAQS